MALSSLRMASAWSLVMPSGMLMVTDSALTALEAVLLFTAAALAGGAAFVGAALCVDGRLCAPTIRLHASTNHPRRPIFSSQLLRPITDTLRSGNAGRRHTPFRSLHSC